MTANAIKQTLLDTITEAVDVTNVQRFDPEVPWVYVGPYQSDGGWIKLTAVKNSSACDWCIYGDIVMFVDYVTGEAGAFKAGETIYLRTVDMPDNVHLAYVMHTSVSLPQYIMACAQRGF